MVPADLLTLLSARLYPHSHSVDMNPGGVVLSISIVVFGLIVVLSILLLLAISSHRAKRVGGSKTVLCKNGGYFLLARPKKDHSEETLPGQRNRSDTCHETKKMRIGHCPKPKSSTFDELQIEELTEEILV